MRDQMQFLSARGHCRFVFVLIVLSRSISFGQEAVISGEVRDERLRPIQGALASIGLIPAAGERAKPFSVAIPTDRSGQFSIAAPAGEYRVCAFLPNSDLLSGCLWGKSSFRIRLGAGQKAVAPPITLQQGYRIELVLEDRGKLLQSRNAKGAISSPFLSVRGAAGFYVPMTKRAVRDEEQEFHALVPRDMPVEVTLSSAAFTFADGNGAALDTKDGKAIAFRVTGNDGGRKVRLQVTGKKDEAQP